MSPDPYEGSYNFSNPQSFNRYVYAINNPLSNIDPTGLYCFYGGAGDSPGSDPDSTDYDMDAQSAADCGDGGVWVDVSVTTYVNGDDPTDPGITIEDGQQIYPTIGPGGGEGAPNNSKPETPARRQLRENAQELQNQVNHPFAWNGPQMTGFKIGLGIAILGNAVAGCATGVLLTTAATEGAAAPAAEATCTGGAIANSISPLALASDLLTGGAGLAVAQYQLGDQAQQAWAQYDAACR